GYENTPIIAFTALAMEGDKEFILNGGATHYLPKPGSKKELIEILCKALNIY
ncbi:MAG: hypothetical protein IAE91_03885, partial [Ignavibacteriaceae bacterium]|nr:hypothetical protein [Ignavibacteriaceae bacterium]